MVRARLAWFREFADPSVASGPTSPLNLVWRIMWRSLVLCGRYRGCVIDMPRLCSLVCVVFLIFLYDHVRS